jgi:hypothetical protein
VNSSISNGEVSTKPGQLQKLQDGGVIVPRVLAIPVVAERHAGAVNASFGFVESDEDRSVFDHGAAMNMMPNDLVERLRADATTGQFIVHGRSNDGLGISAYHAWP